VIHALDLIGRALLCGVFAVAAVSKLTDRAGTREALAQFGVPAGLVAPGAAALPLAELVTAGLLVARTTAVAGAILAVTLLGLFTGAIAVSIARGRRPACRCFGQLSASPVGGRTLVRNVALMAVAAGVLAAELAAPAPDPVHATLHASTTGVLVGIIALAVVALAAAGRLALALMRAYGRMLLRVDALERRLADLGLDEVDEPLPELGLRPGTVAPLASAARIDGRPFVPEPGKPLLMLFTSPHCGPCTELLADVAAWQEAHRDRLSIVVAVDAPVHGAAGVARRYDLETVIADEGSVLADAFDARGTPSAVLVDGDGNVGSWLAAGADPIRELVRAAVRAAPVSVGQPVPDLEVPALDGAPFALSDLRGRTSALVFWNPGCGFCRQMHAQLRLWEAGVNGGSPGLVIVSSGDPDATAQERFASPVLLDADRVLAGAFGAHGTPMAVLIGPDGRVASDVAVGATGVMELLAPVAVP
jgi:thiol-disulfide isomerase/thioredoxin